MNNLCCGHETECFSQLKVDMFIIRNDQIVGMCVIINSNEYILDSISSTIFRRLNEWKGFSPALFRFQYSVSSMRLYLQCGFYYFGNMLVEVLVHCSYSSAAPAYVPGHVVHDDVPRHECCSKAYHMLYINT